ncbi:MAG TPA: hypothetical protein VFQ65_10075, partial [Kofleriaceae bacterium]|nr:hypothetical protein [Kofleriaceae bacterium]
MKRVVVWLLLALPALAIAQPSGAPPVATAPAPSPAGPPAPIALPKIDHSTQPATANQDEHAENKTKVSSLFAIKVIGGLVALLVLAYLGGNRRVVRFQEQLGITGVITAGFPFVALGALASLPQVGILNHEVLAKLRPILHFGL